MTKELFCSIAAFAVAAGAAHAQSAFAPSVNMYGAPGLIDMPTAEMMPDAELSLTTSNFGKTQKTTLTFQILPRLTGSFRYSKIKGLNAPTTVLQGDILDRSFDISYQIFKEKKILPAVTVGLRDFMGTGIYSGEYIVATKSIGTKLKITGGAGWGRLSDSNTVHNSTRVTGGVPNAGNWFRGPVGFFGGLEWQTPVERLTFKAEYSSDRYVPETGPQRATVPGGPLPPLFDRKSQFNFGLDYNLWRNSSIGLYYMYGSEIGLKFNTNLNPKRPVKRATQDRAPYAIQRRGDTAVFDTGWAAESSSNRNLRTKIDAVLAPQGIRVEGMAINGTIVELRIRNNRYHIPAQAIGRTARAMANTLPASVETFVITPMEEGLPAVSVKLNRSTLENSEFNLNGSEEILASAEIIDADPSPDGMQYSKTLYPKFTWSFAPYLAFSLFDPLDPVRAEIGLRLKGSLHIRPGLSFTGSVTKDIVGNNGQGSIAPSTLPKVRSEASLFREFGDPAIEHLKADYLFKPSRNLYGRVSVGYLETMFGGASAELLWKPVEQKWGVGAEINYVKQRKFDQLLGFRNYSVVTGHVSAYYDFDSGFSAQLDLGRYLAGDTGGTISLTRRFPNGWEVGAYATLTDVSFTDFGEGSFDKGIKLTVPLNWAIGTQTRATASQNLSSLSRDGGARLRIDNRLHPIVRDLHKKNLTAGWGGFLK